MCIRDSSTGIATLADIERAVEACKSVGNNDIAILKCVSQYPAPYKDLNLRTIPHMAETFDSVSYTHLDVYKRQVLIR